MTAKVMVRYRGEPAQFTTATVDETRTDIVWQLAPEKTGQTLDGLDATGPVASSGKPVTATGGGRSAGTSFKLRVDGAIAGPPAPCTGKGKLALTGGRRAVLASGSWTIP
jgi:hypothetical protein